MSDTAVLAIVYGAVATVTTIVSAVLVWLKAREAVIESKNTTSKVEEVHGVVNSERDSMKLVIKTLEELNKKNLERITTLEALLRSHNPP